jgi:ribosomal protein S27AE
VSVSIRLRREWHQALRELCSATGAKVADVIKLWPKCPKCGVLLAEVGGAVTCVKCKTAYRLWTPQ